MLKKCRRTTLWLFALLAVIAGSACSAPANSDEHVHSAGDGVAGTSTTTTIIQQPNESNCGSQHFATIALGDALGYVRAVRLFAEAQDRRLALARLESMMIEQIQAESDQEVRDAAWKYADRQSIIKRAQAQRDVFDNIYVRSGDRGMLEEQLISTYRLHLILEDATKLVDPRSPKPCAAKVWQEIHAATLDAAAR